MTLERIGSPELAETLAHAARTLGDGKRVPEGPNGRVRHCARCERLRPEFERHDSTWTPPLAASWLVGNRRYWSALCRGCGEVEQAERVARGSQETRAVEIAEKRPQIGMPRTDPRRPRLVPLDWQQEEFDR